VHNDFRDANGRAGRIRETVMKRLITVAAVLCSAVLALSSLDASAQRGGGGGGGRPSGGGGGHSQGGGGHSGGYHSGGGHGGSYQGGHYHGGYYRGGHYGGWYGGAYWGWPWYAAWPGYYWGYGYPYYGYYGAYASYPAYEPAPSVYVEPGPSGGAISAAPAPRVLWYYCNDPAGYYPYVQECNSPWVKVLPPPPTASAQAPATPAPK
jgi:hypothetical protein